MDIETFFRRHQQALGLSLKAGREGLSQPLTRLEQLLIAPRGAVALEALHHHTGVVICNGHQPPGPLCHYCDAHAIPLFSASAGEATVARALSQSLAQAPPVQEYPKIGTVVELYGRGVLLSGPSGVGKSELALALVDRGHALVVDDGPEFQVLGEGSLQASCPAGFEGLIEVRGIGVVDVRQLFGDRALQKSARLSLVVELSTGPAAPVAGDERLAPPPARVFINTIELPLLKLAPSQGRNLALLVEVAVKRQQLAAQPGRAAWSGRVS